MTEIDSAADKETDDKNNNCSDDDDDDDAAAAGDPLSPTIKQQQQDDVPRTSSTTPTTTSTHSLVQTGQLIGHRVCCPLAVLCGCLAIWCGCVFNCCADCCCTCGKNRREKRQAWHDVRTSVQAFCRESGLTTELEQTFGRGQVILNSRLVAVAQRHVLPAGRAAACRRQRIDTQKDKNTTTITTQQQQQTSSSLSSSSSSLLATAHRFMRFATAAYGRHMIANAAFETGDRLPPLPLVAKTRAAVMAHIHVPNDDENIVVMQLHYGENVHYLRHYCVVDHKHKTVVLAICGTFSVSSTIVDLAGYCEDDEFVPGVYAHAGMAQMARGIWKKSGMAIVQRLQQLPDHYQLVITGHSLGAGVAGLLHLLLHHEQQQQQQQQPQEQSNNNADNDLASNTIATAVVPASMPIYAWIFAGPPTVSSLRQATADGSNSGPYLKAVQNCTSVVFADDIVPHISVNGIRRYAAVVTAVKALHIPLYQTVLMDHEWRKPNEALLTAYRTAAAAYNNNNQGDADNNDTTTSRSSKKAPTLMIPAATVLWMERQDSQCRNAAVWATCQRERYTCTPCDAEKMAKLPLVLTPTSVPDHLTGRYEYSLQFAEMV